MAATRMSPAEEQLLEWFTAETTVTDVSAALVILHSGSAGPAIVYASEAWTHLTGIRAEDAFGLDASHALPGSSSDHATLAAVSEAMAAGRACKALVTCHPPGDPAAPVSWYMLSVSPVTHHGEIPFTLVDLQDYTAHVRRLATPPRVFCRSSAFHQRRVPLLPLRMRPPRRAFATPAVLEADGAPLQGAPAPFAAPPPLLHAEEPASAAAAPTGAEPSPAPSPMSTPPLIRRLGWCGVALEPEYLAARVADGLRSMGAEVGAHETATEAGEQFVVDAKLAGALAVRLVVCADDQQSAGAGGAVFSYSILCTRVAGDTSDYHAAYRTLAKRIRAEEFGVGPAPPLRLVASYGGHVNLADMGSLHI